jgi:hypothetical protein
MLAAPQQKVCCNFNELYGTWRALGGETRRGSALVVRADRDA